MGDIADVRKKSRRRMRTRETYTLYNTWVQVNDLNFKKRHIGIVEKAKTWSDSGMHNRAITVLHEQWMCPGSETHPHHTV